LQPTVPTELIIPLPTTTDIQPMPHVKQTLRYQTKEDLRGIEELRERLTKEDTTLPPATPTTTDTAPTAVPSTVEIPMVVLPLLLPDRPPSPPS
jgi:hypothetical protein